MRKLLSFLAIIYCFLSVCCSHKANTHTSSGVSKWPDSLDFTCGSKVIWSVRLNQGFDNDSVKVIFKKDTLVIPHVKTNESGCSATFISCYYLMERYNLFIDNMPISTAIVPLEGIPEKDSVHLSLMLNDKVFLIKENLKFHRFFGVNYERSVPNIYYLTNSKCFVCK